MVKTKNPQSCNSLLEQLQPILTDCQGQGPMQRDTSLQNLCQFVYACEYIRSHNFNASSPESDVSKNHFMSFKTKQHNDSSKKYKWKIVDVNLQLSQIYASTHEQQGLLTQWKPSWSHVNRNGFWASSTITIKYRKKVWVMLH